MMTIVRSLVLGVAVCAFAACEQKPYSTIKSIEETIFHHGHDEHAKDKHDNADSHGKKEEKSNH